MNQRRVLRELLASERPLIMPDAYDGLSARLIELAGFKAVQCSGFSMALASRAVPEQTMGRDWNLELTRNVVRAVSIPVMADGEDGFGPPAVVSETVAAFLDAGVAGINLEDQVLPAAQARSVVDAGLMEEKVRAARSAAEEAGAPDLVINARTDALAAIGDRAAGVAEAIARGNRYLAAGADLVFVTDVATPDEAGRLVEGIQGPVSIAAGMPYNLRTLSLGALREAGVARVSLPAVAVFSALRAIKETLSLIHRDGELDAVADAELLCSTSDLAAVLRR